MKKDEGALLYGDILVVDDTTDTLRLLADILTAAGFAVRAADSGELALTSAFLQPPELVLLDIRMPKMDGFEVCRRLKADPRTASVPIIFLSGATEMGGRIEGFRLGAVDFMVKPFEREELLMRVRTHLELGRLHKELEQRVRARTAELVLSNLELERATRMKDEFLATMSHELRTPLTAVIGLSEVLLEEIYGRLSPEQRDSVQTIERSGRHLLALINDILDLSKLEAKSVELDWEDCDAAVVARESLHFIALQSQKKQIDVGFETDPDLPVLQADPRRLKQMLINLLSNAVKFTSPGGHIGLQVRHSSVADAVEFTVWDTGIGIKPEDVEKLFQPFVQIDGGLARKYEGTGLGLVLVRRTARLHGGDVTLQSSLGEGSRFTLSLPLRRVFAPDGGGAASGKETEGSDE